MPAQLDVASSPEAMRLPHYRLHALKGRLKGSWSVTVKANWRIVFRFEGEAVYDVDGGRLLRVSVGNAAFAYSTLDGNGFAARQRRQSANPAR